MAPRGKREKLNSLSDIYGYFRRNQTPIYFLSPSAYNLLGLGRWINRFEYINFFDSFDGTHPKVTVPREHGPHEFRSIEDRYGLLPLSTRDASVASFAGLLDRN